MKNELISIIVPVYNVEEYLDRCIQSVLNQSYKNIEIILVDDGSTDKSLEICNKYKKETKIKVFHKKNGGLSSARNFGMKKIKGKYIYFLDSDDYISINTIEILYNSLKNNNGDISCAKELFVYDSVTNLEANKDFGVINYTSENALESILYMNGISNSACNKLYKKELFNNIIFPEGKLYEDLGCIYKVIGKANKIVFNNVFLYNYYIRKGSITHSKFKTNEMDSIEFCLDIMEYIQKYYPKIINSAKYKIDIEAIMLLIKIPYGKYKKEADILKKIIKNNNFGVICDKKVKLNWKLSCLSIIFGRKFAKFTWNIKLMIKKFVTKNRKGNV